MTSVAALLLQRLRDNVCRCCGLKGRGSAAAAPDECSCDVYAIHSCGKCESEHCACPGYVNADGYWQYDTGELAR